VQRREHGLIEASEEQKAEHAEWLDSVRDAAESADAEGPAAEPMYVDAQQGVEQQGDEQGEDEGEGIEQGRMRKRELMRTRMFECGNSGLKRRRLSRTFEFLTVQHVNPDRQTSE